MNRLLLNMISLSQLWKRCDILISEDKLRLDPVNNELNKRGYRTMRIRFVRKLSDIRFIFHPSVLLLPVETK